MIIVQVEHFLNAEGQQYFPDWLVEAASVLGAFDGFISIRQLTKVDDPESCRLLLEFESLELLQAWASSEEHERLIAQLTPYRVKPWESMVFHSGQKLTAVSD